MKFILADPSHDAQLREIVRGESMPGHIRVRYEREPDFFHGLGVQGHFNQVVAAEENDRILGFGCRTIRPMFINGNKTDFGYLSGLRSSPEAKQKLGIARGYRKFKTLHGDGRCPGYITTIIDGNAEAFSTLTQGRAGLPFYRDLGGCSTFAVALRRSQRNPSQNIQVRFADAGEEEKIVALLDSLGEEYQFFPALNQSDFGTSFLRDLSSTNFLFAEKDGVACGIAAIWDQTNYKQHRIQAYSKPLRYLKPLIDAGLKVSGFSPLPPPGIKLNQAYLCFKAAQNNDPEILRALLHFACDHLHQTGFSHCIMGFHDSDPAKGIAKAHLVTRYRSRQFFVGWEKDLETFNTLDGRIPCFEPAIL